MSRPAVRLGTQLFAPEGLGTIPKDERLFFLVNKGVARFVRFEEQPAKVIGKAHKRKEKPPPKVFLHWMKSESFEQALETGLLQLCEEQIKLPPWRAGLKDRDVIAHDRQRDKEKVKFSHEAAVNKKLLAMAPITDSWQEFLFCEDPIRYAKSVARSAKPARNEGRFLADVFLYLAFGLNKNAIAYRIEAHGGWTRRNHPGAKPGKKAKGLGNKYGTKANDDETWDSVRAGWDLFAKPGTPIRRVYRLTQVHVRHCTVVKLTKYRKQFVLPTGEPAETYDQFYRKLMTLVGRDEVMRMVRGRAWHRENRAHSHGKFSEEVNSVAEIVQEDGRWVPELAIGPDGKTPLPSLIVVRIVCVATAMCLGIGFGLGGETGTAYRMARFCMEVDKVFFCWLFGIDIEKEAWPSEGANDHSVRDRGPGQGKTGKPNEASAKPTFNEMPPTGFGQGKPNVESTHEKEIQIGDRPTFVTTRIPLIHLTRREIQKELARMDAGSVLGHMGPTSIAEAESLTPLDFYEKLAAKGRTYERVNNRDDAVRRWLTPQVFSVQADGVYIGNQRYFSSELAETGILAVDGDESQIRGFAVDMCVRYAWVEIKSRLLLVAAILPMREDDEQLYLSLLEMRLLQEKVDAMNSDLRSHRDAAHGEHEASFFQETGRSMEDRKHIPGSKPKKTAEARAIAKAAKDALTSRRAA
jgi:hypothetical protein